MFGKAHPTILCSLQSNMQKFRLYNLNISGAYNMSFTDTTDDLDSRPFQTGASRHFCWLFHVTVEIISVVYVPLSYLSRVMETCFRDSQPSSIQTELYNHTKWRDVRNVGYV